jgi:hypothetical protein
MQRVGAKKQKGKRTDKTSTRSVEVAPTVSEVAKKLGVPEQTARDHLKAAEDYQAAAPEQQARVDAGEFGRWFSDHEQPNEGAFPFRSNWANRLMRMAAHPVLGNPHHGADLPCDLETVYQLSTMTAPALEAAIEAETASQDAPGSTIAPGHDP